MKTLGLALLTLAAAIAASASDFYVSPSGSPDAPGDADHPWDLATALAQPSSVRPGDTIWLRGGTYRGTFTANINGTAAAPIVVRQYPGERATIDGGDSGWKSIFTVAGSYAWYWGFEITSSDPNRVSQQTGSNPTDIGRGNVQTEQSSRTGDGLKFINLVIHDVQDVGLWKEATNVEFYGSLISDNGWNAPDRGHGHGLYVQNREGTKTIRDNVIFQNFCNGIQVYGTENAFLDDITIDGNTIFGNGEIVNSPADNITIGGGVVAHRPVVTDNFVYFSQWGNGNDIDLGYAELGRGTADAVVTGNHLINGVVKQNAGNAGTRMTDNTIYSSIFGWDAAEFPQNKYIWTHPGSTVAFVRPNAYEAGRATIVAYAGSGAPFVPADVSGVLAAGQGWELRNARDFYAPPVASGTYDGKPIRVPMRDLTVASPVGWPAPAPSDEFNVFVLLPLGSAPESEPGSASSPPPSPSPAPPPPAPGPTGSAPNPVDRKGPE
jgi:hypothetical protein